MAREVQQTRILMGRLQHGEDLLKGLTNVCREHDVHLGKVTAIGAVQKARLEYYNQRNKQYEENDLAKPLEISSLVGNVSLKDDQPIVHAHVNLADSDGHVYGGHLSEGTIVFATEYMIEVYEGAAFRRQFDGVTGLPLWD
jgi:hypothetical protein